MSLAHAIVTGSVALLLSVPKAVTKALAKPPNTPPGPTALSSSLPSNEAAADGGGVPLPLQRPAHPKQHA